MRTALCLVIACSLCFASSCSKQTASLTADKVSNETNLSNAAGVLMSSGASDYTIITPDDATPAEQYAAEELRDHLEKISGVTLDILVESEAGDGPHIYVGPGKKAKGFISDAELKSLGEEGLIIRTSGNDLYIVGGRPRGTLYGVYAFLEDHLGVRWYAPDETYIPKMNSIQLGSIDDKQLPGFEYREPYFSPGREDVVWSVRNRINSISETDLLTDKYGGGVGYSKTHSAHTMIGGQLILAEDNPQSHPEYFALRYYNGFGPSPTNPNAHDKTPEATDVHATGDPPHTYRFEGQLCPSNFLTIPSLLQLAIKRVTQWIKDEPDAKIFSLSQYDNQQYCQCPKCMAQLAIDGALSGPILRFVNAVADAIAKTYPDKIIDTFAYQYSDVAPAANAVQPHSNVIVRYCPIQHNCSLHPMNACTRHDGYFWNSDIAARLVNWIQREGSGKIYIWDYVTNFSHFIMPFPDLTAIIADIPYLKQLGVKGYFGQGSALGPGGDMALLKEWLIAKLLWNPNADGKALIQEFTKGYYGAAAPAMQDYIDAIQKVVEDNTVHSGLYSDPEPVADDKNTYHNSSFLKQDTLVLADQCFDRAEQLAKDDGTILDRVRLARLPLTYVRLMWPHLYGAAAPQNRPALFEQFKADLKYFKITHIKETVDPLEKDPADQSKPYQLKEIEDALAVANP